jgi:LVIVD repeat
MSLQKRAPRRLAAIVVAGLLIIGGALYGAAAFAGEGDVNTIRVMPGPTTAAEAAAVAAAQAQLGADYVASENGEFVRSFKLGADGVGARVVGRYLYVTTTKDLEIFDISTPTDPQLLGLVTIDVEFENEQVPTNGFVLGISGQADFHAAPNDTKRFVHGVEFPRQGADKIMLAGGETNFQPICDDTRARSPPSGSGTAGGSPTPTRSGRSPATTWTAIPRRAPITSAARCTGSRRTRASTTAAWSQWPRTRTARGF